MMGTMFLVVQQFVANFCCHISLFPYCDCSIAFKALAKEIREFKSPTDGETRIFYEIVVAPKYSQKGLEVLCGKSKT